MLKHKHLKAGNSLYSVVDEMRKDIDWFGITKNLGIPVGAPCMFYAVIISDRLAARYPDREIYPVFGSMTARYSKHKSGCLNYGSMLENKSFFALGGFAGHAWIEMKAGGRTFWIDATLGAETRASVETTDARMGLDTIIGSWPFDSVTIFEARQSNKSEFEQVRDGYKPSFAYNSDGRNKVSEDLTRKAIDAMGISNLASV